MIKLTVIMIIIINLTSSLPPNNEKKFILKIKRNIISIITLNFLDKIEWDRKYLEGDSKQFSIEFKKNLNEELKNDKNEKNEELKNVLNPKNDKNEKNRLNEKNEELKNILNPKNRLNEKNEELKTILNPKNRLNEKNEEFDKNKNFGVKFVTKFDKNEDGSIQADLKFDFIQRTNKEHFAYNKSCNFIYRYFEDETNTEEILNEKFNEQLDGCKIIYDDFFKKNLDYYFNDNRIIIV